MSFEQSARAPQPEQQMGPEAAAFMEQSLGQLGPAMLRFPLPKEKYHYPDFNERLFISPGESPAPIDELSFGWCAGQVRPTGEERIALQASGLILDRTGAPQHPWLARMLTDPTIGILQGKGWFYNWGPNYTADPVILQNGRVLLILRDNGQWAFPGGFVEDDERAAQAAIREGGEESDIDPALLVNPILVYQGPVADMRMTAHAWPETSAFLFVLPDGPSPPTLTAKDDALDAQWFPIETARALPLYGSHNTILELALSAADQPQQFRA